MKRKLMNIWMISCLKATELIEKKSVMPLSWIDKVKLKIHLRLCDPCLHYEQQSKAIDEWVKSDNSNNSSENIDTTPLQEKIIQALPPQQ
ncbi:hypothetical protein [Hydrotalea sp.]|uniref:hypothetical protein n=1 Tax=Hydrotalea sp. TaxID=2881279 RepID=UPI003D103FED